MAVHNPRLSIVIPVYNSEDTIGDLLDELVRGLQSELNLCEIILINDGSLDDSHTRILAAIERQPDLIKYVRLNRNFGEHNAVMCGLSCTGSGFLDKSAA